MPTTEITTRTCRRKIEEHNYKNESKGGRTRKTKKDAEEGTHKKVNLIERINEIKQEKQLCIQLTEK